MEGKIRKKLIKAGDYRFARHIDPLIFGCDTCSIWLASRRLPSSTTVSKIEQVMVIKTIRCH